jgi:hypothetical protein
VNDRARRIANLPPEKRRLLELMLQERAEVRMDEGIPALPRLSESGQPRIFPLSSAQRLMWFNEQASPGAHNMSPQAIRLRGPLDVAALQASLHEICRRWQIRTLAPVPGYAAALAAEGQDWPLALCKWSGRRATIRHESEGGNALGILRASEPDR